MTEEELQTLNKEQKEQDYLGKTALQVYAEVLRLNPTIQRVQFRQYRYTYPQAPDGRGIHEDTSFWIEREDFLKGSKIFQDSLANLSDGFNLALESELELENGERAYLPMMDTSIPKSTENLERLKKITAISLTPSFGRMVILETDASYHIMGFAPMSLPEQVRFLGVCQNNKIKSDDGRVRRVADIGFT
ncbi:MAG TPA: hypothetical protein VF189_03430, partial [Patescibacteria group bacterium]